MSAPFAQASEIELFSPRVTHEGGQYLVEMAAMLPLEREVLFAAVTDYDHLDRISTSILSSKSLGLLDNGATELQVKMKVCVLLVFCPTFQQTQEVVGHRPAKLDAVIPARAKNLFEGTAHWEFLSEGEGTIIKFESTLTPLFWVPPWIGPSLIQSVLTKESDRVLAGLSALHEHEKSASR
ncbi:MAG: hypothetical protein JRC77_04745 [Deltaproteobacteria bacterium]|nr:hypothetical protein [Deltaproteobacteria bacterium]